MESFLNHYVQAQFSGKKFKMSYQLPMPMKAVAAALSEGKAFGALRCRDLKTVQRNCSEAKLSSPVEEWARFKTRRPHEIPPLYFEIDSHSDMNGSAIFAMGDCTVAVGVLGPVPRTTNINALGSMPRKLREAGVATISSNSLADASLEITLQFHSTNNLAQEPEQQSLEDFLTDGLNCLNLQPDLQRIREQRTTMLKEAMMEILRSSLILSAHPNCTIHVHITVTQEDEDNETYTSAAPSDDLLPCMVNACSLALMRARIPMVDVLAAVSAYTVELPEPEKSMVLCLGLNWRERAVCRRRNAKVTKHVLALLCSKRTIAYLNVNGIHLKEPWNAQMATLAQEACVAIGHELVSCIKDQTNADD